MYIIIGIIIVLIIFLTFLYNKLTMLKKNVHNSKSGIDVYLQQRFDLIPNLINVTKGYVQYEKEMLERIVELRNLYTQNKKDIKTINELNSQYNHILAMVENYPELKASEQFLKLQKALVKVESQLQAARRIYNNDVTRYNTKISVFPNNLFAKHWGFEAEELFTFDGE